MVKNIAIIIPRIAQLGPVKVIQTLVNSLSLNPGLKIKLIYLDSDVDKEMKFWVPVEKYDGRSFKFENFDIIHTNGIRPDYLAYKNRKRIKFHISTIHNFVFEDLAYTYNRAISFLFGRIWLHLWNRTDKLVCVSDSLKEYYDRWFSSDKLELIYNGVSEADYKVLPDDDFFDKVKLFKSGKLKIIGASGVITKIKGFNQLLHLIASEQNLALIILGDGKELSTLKSLARRLRIDERCYFTGFRSDAVKYYKYFDYFIMPSHSEGFGLSLVEAVQQKVPVICSDIPVFRELFNDKEVTFFEPDNISSLVQAMKQAMLEGVRKVDLAFQRYEANYTDLLMAKHYLDLYQSASLVKRRAMSVKLKYFFCKYNLNIIYICIKM